MVKESEVKRAIAVDALRVNFGGVVKERTQTRDDPSSDRGRMGCHGNLGS